VQEYYQNPEKVFVGLGEGEGTHFMG